MRFKEFLVEEGKTKNVPGVGKLLNFKNTGSDEPYFFSFADVRKDEGDPFDPVFGSLHKKAAGLSDDQIDRLKTINEMTPLKLEFFAATTKELTSNAFGGARCLVIARSIDDPNTIYLVGTHKTKKVHGRNNVIDPKDWWVDYDIAGTRFTPGHYKYKGNP